MPQPRIRLGAFSLRSLVGVRRASVLIRRTIRAVRLAATDARIPKPLRWLAALGLAPIPGPFDEVLLVIVAVPLAPFYREPLAEAWTKPSASRAVLVWSRAPKTQP